MIFLYEICPHCMKQLIERKQPIEDNDSVNFCPKCGKKMVWACYGEQKTDNTVYKIILNDASLSDNMDQENRFLSALMKIGDCDREEALQRYGTKDSVIFEGNVSDAYVSMGLLDGFTSWIHYTVVPEFPFERFLNPFVSICPNCGSDTIYKTEDIDNPPNYMKDGFFCENCNEWVMVAAVPKEEDYMDNLPPKTEWTEEDIQDLIAANPGLTVTAEEMNALN